VRGRDVRCAGAALVLLLPATATAFDWAAQVGLLYDRSDTWAENIPRTTQPRLDLDLRLDLRGAIGGPGILAYGGSAAYRRTTTELNGERTGLDNVLTYNVEAAVLQNRKSPVGLTLFARRIDGRYETSLGQPVAGDRVTDTFGGTFRLVGATTPGLELGYRRTAYDEQFGSLPTHSLTNDSVSARVSQSAGAFALGASYQGDWNDGTWVADQFESREVNFSGSVFLSPEKDIVVVDRYYRRIPTTAGPDTFGVDTNSFRAALRLGRTPGDSTTLAYSDRRSRTESAGLSGEALDNSLRYSQDFRLRDPTFFVRVVADLSMTEQRTVLAELRSQGGTVGPELWWRRTTTSEKKIAPGVREGTLVEISGGPRAGVLAVDGEPVRYGYGAVLRARANGAWRSHDVGGNYALSYGNDLFGLRGWVVEQQGSATIAGAAGLGRFNAQATLLSRRGWNPILGDEASRSFSLLGNYTWRRYTAFGQASISSGILPGTGSFVGDGVLVPVGFATQSAAASAGASVALLSGLTARASGGYTQSFLPGQPDLSILDANAALAYRYGAFDVTIDDRITRTENGVAPITRNVVFVRISRTIGSRF